MFVAGVGTGGTITGVGRYLRERKPEVEMGGGGDPEGSIFCGGSRSAMFIRRTGKEYDNDR